jgi:hypothetical protein
LGVLYEVVEIFLKELLLSHLILAVI